ncbi:DUF4114 domain-containing protein [Spirulina sp. CS-785/01]|uniref:DUF4114 domain-containing protein n=1 Tax=Spirulina sp. CS-785/01 TaxID=3021716 RepID=UPI00232DAC8E|nr:DUF4114 domain-containing protein [Spirulina sp. CS-785/01]MDB9315094.1 DUF4114 domain-containing protein [Spirulina sp. CS-785/01]
MFKRKKRQTQKQTQLQSFILEPILTPSGLVDVDDISGTDIVDIPTDLEDLQSEDQPLSTLAENSGGEGTVAQQSLAWAENGLEPADLPSDILKYDAGVFTVGESGEVGIDFLFDGGKFKGEVAIFSLEGMDNLEPGSEEFITEAVTRATSETDWGHVVISDRTEGARFEGSLGESKDWNSGDYQGVKTVSMRPGDSFGVMLVPNGTVQEVLNDPDIGGSKAPLFSLGTANPDDTLHFGQIADVTGDGNTFVMEDVQFGHKWYDEDYNDLIFQVRGAEGEAPSMDELIEQGVIDAEDDWREGDLGQALVEYAKPYIEPEPMDDGGGETEIVADDPQLDNESNSEPPEDPTPEQEETTPKLTETTPERSEERELRETSEGIVKQTGFEEYDLERIKAERAIALEEQISEPISTENADLEATPTPEVSNTIDGEDWTQTLQEKVDEVKASEASNTVLHLNPTLTELDAQGNEVPRLELTAQERAAISYAQQNGVVLVVPSGDDADAMSVLGQLSTEFDNVITVGAAEQVNDAVALSNAYEGADASGGGIALDLAADGRQGKTVSSAIAANEVTEAVVQVWEANPELNYTQVIDILKRTATDLEAANWDTNTGYGLLNVASAIHLAKATQPEPYRQKPGNPDITDEFISSNPAGKELPGIPEHPEIDPPSIPETDIDQGGNTIAEATTLLPSSTQDVIDQVSNSDPTDIFQVDSRYVDGAGLSVLAGELSVSYLTPSGEVLGTQVLPRGEHKLELPANAPDEVIVKVDNRGTTPTTYVLEGFESTEAEPFNVELEFDSAVTASQQQVMQAAAASVAKLIGKGLPTAIVDGKLIDDIKIKVSGNDLDGEGGTQARTQIDFMRYGTLLPAQSLVQFDNADIAELEKSGQLFSAAQHEFFHTLGFGNLWEAKGLVDYPGTPLARYNGQSAVKAFKELGGLTDNIALETEGEGSAGLHWNENLFSDELMSHDANFGSDDEGNAPISGVTLASLADLGYEVNLDEASPDFALFGEDGVQSDELTPEQLEAFRQQAEASLTTEEEGEEYIAPIMPEVDPATVAPEIWAHAEKFWKNGEYYDWKPYKIRSGDTLSHIAQRYLGSGLYDYYMWIANRNGIPNPDYIVTGDTIEVPVHHPNYEQKQEAERRRREEELRRKQEEEERRRREEEERLAREKEEQERKAREEEERRREAERKQRELEEQERRLREEMERRRREEERRKELERLRELERQREIARQKGKGGQDWFFATRLPEFGPSDPFETKLTGETVGNLVPDDYYRFTLSRKGRLTAELKQLLADADMVLYDARNKPIAYSMREGITDEQIITDLIPGTYMLRVNSPEGVTTDYDLVMKFQHKLSRTQQGPPPGWRVGGGNRGGSGSSGPVFSDPRINQIYTTALNNFAGPERAKANARIRQLQAEKRGYEQDLQELLNQMNAEQRAKVHRALDDARHNANVWTDNKANDVKGAIDGTANWILGQIDSKIPGWVYGTWGIGDSLRNAKDNLKGKINDARNWLKGKVAWVQDRVKNAIWHFIETVKNSYRTGAEINGIIENAANEMRRKIDSAVSGINHWVGEFKGKITGALGWTRNIGAFGWNFYDKVVEPLANSVANGIQGKVNDVGNFAKGAVNWVKPRAQKAVAAVVDALFGDKTGHLYNKIHKVDEQIAATQSELERKIVQKATELKNQMQGFLNTLGSKGKKLLDTILNFANSTGGQVTIELIKVALGFVPIVGQAIDVVDTAIALWKVVVDGRRDVEVWVELLGSLAGWFPGIGDAIKGIAKVALKSPIGALLRKLGPDVTKQAAKIFKEANWKAIVTDVIEGLAGVWRKFDSQMDSAAGWILDLMPGVRPAMAAVGEIVVKFNDEAAEAGKYLDDVSQQIAKKIDDTSEQIAKEDSISDNDDEDGYPINDSGNSKKNPEESDSRSKSIKQTIQQHINDLEKLYNRSNKEISDNIKGKKTFLKNLKSAKDTAEKYQNNSEDISVAQMETLKNKIAGFDAELNDALRPNVKLTAVGTKKSGQEIDNIGTDLRDEFTVFTEVKNNASINSDYVNKQAKRVIEAASRDGLFTKARFVFLKGLDPQIEEGIKDLGEHYGVIVEIET